ncbi:MAG: DUF512 domain-containing protein, partial [Oscillospiraceae bacterium]|nr:DUF512 domain-containing protein [Oscillospiraceae bacterium]
MSCIIRSIEKSSPLTLHRVKPGDILLAVNGHTINDALDYGFYCADVPLCVTIQKQDGSISDITVGDEYGEDIELGLEFDTYLMDEQRQCENNCIFCFIDQLPKGMRNALYFKDDDSRLGFLFGNYVTLTNITREEINRIINMRISPINVSYHTADPLLRVRIMRNRNAGKCLGYLRILADAGITLNLQIVLCPGINDGAHLEHSLNVISKLGDSVQSIACVPVGLTKHRRNLYPLEPYTKQDARKTIKIIDSFNQKLGRVLAYASDEFYLTAQLDIPAAEHYGEFHQLENGVGMLSLFESQFMDELKNLNPKTINPRKPVRISISTGTAAYPMIKTLIQKFCEIYVDCDIQVYS